MYIFAKKILLDTGWKSNITLHIKDGLITDIIEGAVDSSIAKKETVETVGVVIPGMINCHSHAFQRAFAGFSEIKLSDADSFWSWRKVMYDFLSQLSTDDVAIIAQQLYIEMLKAGYTRVAEFHYLHFDQNDNDKTSAPLMAKAIFDAAQHAGIGLTFLPVLYQYSGFGQTEPLTHQHRFTQSVDEFNQLVTQCFEYTNEYNNTNVGIAPHSLRAVDKASLVTAVEHVRALDVNAPIHIHIAEQQQEVDDCVSFYGKRPVEWLLDNVALDQHWCLIHATHINEQEQRGIIEQRAVVGICPTTEANLGDGVFPTVEFLSEGGVFAIGSDSHISVNPIEELRWLEYAQRLVKQKRALLASELQPSVGTFLWNKALQGGQLATTHNIGKLAVGQQADLLVLNQEMLATFAADETFILDSLIFASQTNMVDCVMVHGQWVVRKGEHEKEEQTREQFSVLLAQLSKTQ